MGQVPWQFFCTLTWANQGSFKRPPSPRRQVCAAFAFFREAAHVAGVHFKKSMWCLRYETGEMTGRDHYHCLLSVLGSEWVADRNVFLSHGFLGEEAALRPCPRPCICTRAWRRGLYVQRPRRKSGGEGSL